MPLDVTSLCLPYLLRWFPFFVQSLSPVRLFVTPWTATCQASLSFTNYRRSLKLVSMESVMPPNHFVICRLPLLLPSIFPSIRVFSNKSVLLIRWPKYWSFSFSISPSNKCFPKQPVFVIYIYSKCKNRYDFPKQPAFVTYIHRNYTNRYHLPVLQVTGNRLNGCCSGPPPSTWQDRMWALKVNLLHSHSAASFPSISLFGEHPQSPCYSLTPEGCSDPSGPCSSAPGKPVQVLVSQSCPTLHEPMDYSPPGSSICGIFQAWVAISFSRGSSPPRDRTWVSHNAGSIGATREAP